MGLLETSWLGGGSLTGNTYHECNAATVMGIDNASFTFEAAIELGIS